MIDLFDLRGHGLNYSDEQIAAAQAEIDSLASRLDKLQRTIEYVRSFCAERNTPEVHPVMKIMAYNILDIVNLDHREEPK